ncbi:hypothetical protein [Pontibacter sp. H249]|uniref:hypothetical protein n=1 Tax=Pontibacter sp. H249 TaxID=3133420 RepID=UPI0030BB8FA2
MLYKVPDADFDYVMRVLVKCRKGSAMHMVDNFFAKDVFAKQENDVLPVKASFSCPMNVHNLDLAVAVEKKCNGENLF